MYKPWSSAIWNGSHNPILRAQQRSPWLLTTITSWDDPPSWDSNFPKKRTENLSPRVPTMENTWWIPNSSRYPTNPHSMSVHIHLHVFQNCTKVSELTMPSKKKNFLNKQHLPIFHITHLRLSCFDQPQNQPLTWGELPTIPVPPIPGVRWLQTIDLGKIHQIRGKCVYMCQGLLNSLYWG